MVTGGFEKKSRKVFGRRVEVQGDNRLSGTREEGDQRIVPPQKHAVVQMLLYEAFQPPGDFTEIPKHASGVQVTSGQHDFHLGVVPVKVGTLAGVVQ